jgi:hypothetical protein
MSAYLVDPEHINVMVYFAMQSAGGDVMSWRVDDDSEIFGCRAECAHYENRDRIGQMLLDQNAASVNHKYDEDSAYIYSYQPPKFRDWQPIEIISATQGYEYQACETPEWRDSEAYAFCQALQRKMIRQIAGYDGSPWEITARSMPAHVAKAVELKRQRDAVAASTVIGSKESAGGIVVALADRSVTEAPSPVSTSVDRDTAIKAIRSALRRRSGKAWSVRGGRGTSWGWITISAAPARLGRFGELSDEDRAELERLLGVTVHSQGVTVAASNDYRREFIARAEGREPEAHGQPYWD